VRAMTKEVVVAGIVLDLHDHLGLFRLLDHLE
jgi:hypothetical protein